MVEKKKLCMYLPLSNCSIWATKLATKFNGSMKINTYRHMWLDVFIKISSSLRAERREVIKMKWKPFNRTNRKISFLDFNTLIASCLKDGFNGTVHLDSIYVIAINFVGNSISSFWDIHDYTCQFKENSSAFFVQEWISIKNKQIDNDHCL